MCLNRLIFHRHQPKWEEITQSQRLRAGNIISHSAPLSWPKLSLELNYAFAKVSIISQLLPIERSEHLNYYIDKTKFHLFVVIISESPK